MFYVKRQRRQWLALGAAVKRGEVIAYPCEGVLGVGCDPKNPKAIRRLLTLKKRPEYKGLILLASHWGALSRWIKVSATMRSAALAHWPGPVTCVLPAQPQVSHGVRGKHPSLACRISDFMPLRILAAACGGVVISTSANLAQHPAWSPWTLRRKLGHHHLIMGPTGGRLGPTAIYDIQQGTRLR